MRGVLGRIFGMSKYQRGRNFAQALMDEAKTDLSRNAVVVSLTNLLNAIRVVGTITNYERGVQDVVDEWNHRLQDQTDYAELQ